MRSRVLGMMASLLVILSLVAGCATTQNPAPAAPSGGTEQKAAPAAPQEVTIELWHPMSGPAAEDLDKQVAEFQAKNPGIKVKVTYTPTTGQTQMSEKLLTAIAAGNPPDVAYFDRFLVGQWATKGSLTELTPLAQQAGLTKDQFYDFAWAEASLNGKLYAVPMNTGARALFWNKDLFKAAGLDPEKPPKTIAELDQYAEKLFKKEGGRYSVIGFIPWYNQGWLYTWGWAFGGDFYDVNTKKVTTNDPKVVEALTWMGSYASKYGAQELTSVGAWGQQNDPFFSGQLAMVVSVNGYLPSLKKYAPNLNYGVAPLPTKDGSLSTWAGGWSWVIPKGAKNEKAAFEFIKFMAGPDSQYEQALVNNALPVHKEAAAKLAANSPEEMKVFIKLLEIARYRPVIPEGGLLWNELASAQDQVINGKKDPKAVLDAVTTKVNTALDKYK